MTLRASVQRGVLHTGRCQRSASALFGLEVASRAIRTLGRFGHLTQFDHRDFLSS